MPSFYSLPLARIHQDAYESFALSSAPQLLALFRRHRIRPPQHVLDLACGPGGWARALTSRGYRVTGIDVSPAMIRLARRRAPRARFTCASITRTALPACDAATALGEAVNYLLRPADLRGLFRRVHAALRPGGLFLFDARVPPRSRRPTRRSILRVEKRWAMFTVVTEDPSRALLTREMTWFLRATRSRKSAAAFQRGRELHHQRFYPTRDLSRWLRDAGFRVRILRNYPRSLNAHLRRVLPRRRHILFAAFKP